LTLNGSIGTILRWESSVDNFGAITTTTTSNINLTASPTVDTKYRAVVQNGSCDPETSSEIEIIVNALPTTTDIPNQVACFEDVLTLGDTVETTGYSYLWSSTGETTSSIELTVTASGSYSLTTTEIATGCSIVDSFEITMQPLPDATVIANANICEGEQITIGATDITTSTYSWVASDPSYTWDLNQDTDANPSVDPLVTTSFTLTETVTATGCQQTNTVLITVNPASTGGTISATATEICEGSSTTLTLNGSIGTILRWESSVDDFVTTTTIVTGSDSLNESPTVSTKYRAVVQNGSCTPETSDQIEIIVDATVVPGTVSGGSTICENDASDLLTLADENGTVTIWQSSTDEGINWNNILGTEGSTSYTAVALDQTTSFRAMVTNGTCAAQPSVATNVIINDALNVGVLNITSGAATVCENTAVDLELTGEVGTIIRWESKESLSVNWNSISNTTSTFTTDLLAASTQFRVFTENGSCESGYSPVQEIIVEKTPTYSSFSTSSSPICSGTTTNLELTITDGILDRWETRPTTGGI
ncbi:MAG: hypothetical protein ACKVJK_22855, partial [Methylophagaceae bacterium]